MQKKYKYNTQKKSKTSPQSQPVTLDISRVSHQGAGIAQHAGKTWFVVGASPAERVVAVPYAERRGIVEAVATRVVQADAQRQTPPCPLYLRCGGCSLQHITAQAGRQLKREALTDQLQRFAGVEVPDWAPDVGAHSFGYRHRVRFSLSQDTNTKQWTLGFRSFGGREHIAVEQCPVLAQALSDAIPAMREWLMKFPKKVKFKALSATLDPQGKIGLALDASGLPEHAQLEKLAAQWPGPVEILGTLFDPDSPLFYAVGDPEVQVQFKASNFTQVNWSTNQELVLRVMQWLDFSTAERVLDLFCGVGNFALPMAQKGAQVLGLEMLQDMVEQAGDNAARNHLSADFVAANLYTYQLPSNYRLAVIDPPRQGIDSAVESIKHSALERLVYVSCQGATLARDVASLSKAGFTLTDIALVDFFAQTGQLEAVLLLQR